jgi:bifunctional UDP-N-acetylglucosamine pyrophosphorylase/glucosamine-1-phosphate N-acetyltransferase
MPTQIVILAAGQGARMNSSVPKVLHHLAGKPLLEHVITTALTISPNTKPIIITGHQSDIIKNKFQHYDIEWVEQKEQLGTGHAVLQALPHLKNDHHVLILYGDVPLISVETLKKLIDDTPNDALGMLSAIVSNPKGYGRIKRDSSHHVMQIIEENDATQDEKNITEINPGIYFVPVHFIKKWLPQIKNHNAKNEYYITDMIALAVSEKCPIYDVSPAVTEEILGVNDQVQLAKLERVYQHQSAEKLMRQGVTILDPNRIDVRGEVKIGKDVTIDIDVIFEGSVVIGDGCYIGPYSVIRRSVLGERVVIQSHSVIDGSKIGNDCHIGPYARLRINTILGNAVHIGNFVETKNTIIQDHSKANHLSYLGDADIGQFVNVGAGTITCNYDGANKHKTHIGNHVFIGSDTQLVAPVSIGNGVTIGAGSTITKDVPPDVLVMNHRLDQRINKDWIKPKK